ncbi:MAG: threonylcarbamoyl-AMP synthase [Armatimonadetes bacterium]|nr:threonylcarbamoyl-AMP synthase [Armatimonadota bacterium]
MTRVLRLQAPAVRKHSGEVAPSDEWLRTALTPVVSALTAGGLALVPTETVFGLTANALDEAAVRKVFALKGRSGQAALPIQVAEVSVVVRWVSDLTPEIESMLKKLWPGPLTVILKKKDEVPTVVTGGKSTVGVRVPAHPVTSCLLRMCGFPLVMTSANRSGQSPATTGEEACAAFDGTVDYIVDGDAVPEFRCREGVSSTVVDVTRDPPLILRKGPVSAETLRQFLPDLSDASAELEV